jgi:PhnB protein
MHVLPYLFFDGRCEEALAFYRDAVGAEVGALMRYKDSPEPMQPAPPGEKVMHCEFRVGDTAIMASDGHCTGTPSFKGFSLTLAVDDEAGAHRHFEALSQGGKVEMPLTKTFFSPCFGMLTDRFGVGWMVIARS